jgi:hypothetical protein
VPLFVPRSRHKPLKTFGIITVHARRQFAQFICFHRPSIAPPFLLSQRTRKKVARNGNDIAPILPSDN